MYIIYIYIYVYACYMHICIDIYIYIYTCMCAAAFVTMSAHPLHDLCLEQPNSFAWSWTIVAADGNHSSNSNS